MRTLVGEKYAVGSCTVEGAGSHGSFKIPCRGCARVLRGEEVTERPAALDGCSAKRRERECEGSFGILPCREKSSLKVRSFPVVELLEKEEELKMRAGRDLRFSGFLVSRRDLWANRSAVVYNVFKETRGYAIGSLFTVDGLTIKGIRIEYLQMQFC